MQREVAFPTNTFPDDSLRWTEFRSNINSRPRVFIDEANFIPGGCILAIIMENWRLLGRQGLLDLVSEFSDQ